MTNQWATHRESGSMIHTSVPSRVLLFFYLVSKLTNGQMVEALKA